MSFTGSLVQTLTIDGVAFRRTLSGTGNSVEKATPSVPAAKAGTLSARTDNDTGTLTLGSGHGVTDGQLIDVYWTGGSRRGMTVGTVAGTSVPVDGGSGDNLPAAATVVTAAVPTQVSMAVTGDDVDAIGSYSSAYGWVVYRNGSTVLLTHRIDPANGDSDQWVSGSDITNPLAGVSVTNVLFSHADSTQARGMTAAVIH